MSKKSVLEWSDEQLEEAGLDKGKVESIARKLKKLSQEMEDLGLSVYGNGTGHLIHVSHPTHDDNEKADTGSIVAMLGRGFTGGDW